MSISPLTLATGQSASATVQVLESGKPLAGAQVMFSTTGGLSMWSPATATTDASGMAMSAFSASAPGVYTVAASVSSGGKTVTTAQITITVASASVATQLVKISGDNQTVQIGTTFGSAVTVEARNAFGQPVPGVDLDFVVSGGTTRLTTLSDGRVSILLGVNAGSLTGAGTVVVSLASNPSVTVTFGYTVVP
ncbi:MAG: Ig-like domain-containing protein [Gemmatimonadetes bacterium]|nr:Ig-like domain-containing protein [Gemmatimonadota bacterium]